MVLNVPPLDLLLSWQPNLIDPVRRGPQIYAVTGIFLPLSTLAVFARLYARVGIRRWFGLDDAFIVAAWLATVGVAISLVVQIEYYHQDRHVWDIPFMLYASGAKGLFISCLFWAASSSFVRLSLLCFYYRLLEHIHAPSYRWALHIVFIFSVAFAVAYLFTLVFMCIPLSSFWTYPDDLTAKCINVGAFLLIMSILNTLLELITALLPVPVVFLLAMERRQRWSVVSLLSLGVLVFLVGCVRCWFVYKSLLATWDMAWWAEPHWACSEVENNLALICACAPALRPVLGRLFSSRPLHVKPKRQTGTDTTSKTQSFKYIHPREKVQYSVQSTCVWFDLEGIAHDGVGYSVSITTGRNGRRAGRLQKRSGEYPLKRSASRLMRRLSTSQRHAQQPIAEEKPIEIVERRSLEIRESFHDNSNSEEIHVWRSFSSEKDSDANNGSYGFASGRPTRTQSREHRSFVLPSSDGDLLGQRHSDGLTSTTTRTTTTPSPLPQAHHTHHSRQSPDQPHWLSPPASPRGRSGPANPLNSSQWWAGSHPPTSRLSDASHEDSTAWALEMATMRDVYRWQKTDGSMCPEDGSRSVSQNSRSVDN